MPRPMAAKQEQVDGLTTLRKKACSYLQASSPSKKQSVHSNVAFGSRGCDRRSFRSSINIGCSTSFPNASAAPYFDSFLYFCIVCCGCSTLVVSSSGVLLLRPNDELEICRSEPHGDQDDQDIHGYANTAFNPS